MPHSTRRLAAILSLDVVDFTKLVEHDERMTLKLIGRAFRDLVMPTIEGFGGVVFKTMGDGLLAEFASAVSAVEWTASFQASLINNAAYKTLKVRAGIVLGDVLVSGEDRFGDGVNLAARVQALSPPGGMVITSGVYDYLAGKTGLSFEDIGLHNLKNISKPVKLWRWRHDKAPVDDVSTLSTDPVNPSIVVLPFANLSADPDLSYLADGVVEEITSMLSRVRDFTVIARNSAYAYKGKAMDVRQISRQLGVRYILEGTLRKAGDRLRITAQLIDAETGAHIWAERLEGLAADVFDLQDQVAEQVAGALHPSIREAEIERAKRKRPDNLVAYDLVMRALPHLWAHRADDNARAIELMEQALELDPSYSRSAALSAWAHAQQIAYNWTSDIAAERKKGERLIELAAPSIGNDPTGLTALASAIMLLTGNVRRAVSFIDLALGFDPNHAWAWTRRGFAYVYMDQAEKAFGCFERAMKLSPVDPFGFNCHIGMGLAYFATGNPEKAAQWAEKVLDEKPGIDWPYRDIATFKAHAGDLDAARDALNKFVSVRPGLNCALVADALQFMSPGLLKHYLDGLRLAGLPECGDKIVGELQASPLISTSTC